ncbi:YqeG family HAD IIIA-type phosphatase [Spirulina subsalsa FACHB-351]|uniref:YqeG family HAD IIIA-type phosphatase n=1 Tax=Spirulina subsalsa FACHB-351 TaxID=234711 RepID=A0ABT3L2M8_9CYAN|nr:YqeG family HAD IIIA-type phosphatase [Spirulina subsalsa]MCW6035767.1 YqeG family HAD IIIA-type phosphatase [Spirulina subsalsa FACHB-351]
MTFTRFLKPDLMLQGSVVDITPDLLQHHQLKGLVLDVDETLVPLRERTVSSEVAEWLEEVRPLVDIWLVSNNLSESRIGGIAESLRVPYLLGARKPSRKKLRQALEAMGHPVEQVAMVGDRLLTDALAGNRLGMFTILVEPMIDPAISQGYPIRNFEVWLTKILGFSLQDS